MKRIAVSTLKATLSACLAKVKAGDEVLVMERGKPIAKLVPLAKDSGGTLAHMHELARAGLVRVGSGKLPDGVLETSQTEGSEAARAPGASGRAGRGTMRFWDASALIPLCLQDQQTGLLKKLAQEDEAIVVWWGSPVECVSALARLRRENVLSPAVS